MERRYINADRYKKVSRTASRKRTVKKINTNNSMSNKNIQKKKSNNKRYKVNKNKFVRFIFCLFLLMAIAVIARSITIEEDEPFIPIFSNNEGKENTDSINIAIYDNVDFKINNLVITELEQYIYPMLLRINSDYSIKNEVVSNVSKLNNKEYELEINENSGITAVDVKDTIDNIIKTKNKYYFKVDNVDKVEIKSENKVYISLKTEDEYFVYNLNIPIYKQSEKYGIYEVDSSSNSNKLVLIRKGSANKEYIKYINVVKVESQEKAIEMYKQNKIDVFFAKSKNVSKMLGKYEYDLKAYNSGESIFLMFNPLSNLAKEKYIRQIVAYSIDRENILKEVGNSDARVIDLPYIYDDLKYKYDVYAAENLLLSNGYIKNKLYYTKAGKKLTLNLLVNKEDAEKLGIANKIKNNLLKVGVNVDVTTLSQKQMESKMKTSHYDMLLASVYINENPNINYLTNSFILTNEIKDKMNIVKNYDVDKLSTNILTLKNTLSDDIGVYGIYSKNNYIISRKDKDIFKNINYMNLFSAYFAK